MPIAMSNKVILITEKPRITTPIKIALNSLGLEILADYPASDIYIGYADRNCKIRKNRLHTH